MLKYYEDIHYFMAGFSRLIISRFYDFVEFYFLRDYEKSLKAIEQFVDFNGNEILVDIGGGTGYILNQFRDKVSCVINLDVSKNMLRQQGTDFLQLIQASGYFVPLKSDSVDIVFLINTLHHIDVRYHQDVMNEMSRILKNKGVIIIIDLYYPMTVSNKLFTFFEEFAVGKTFHIHSKEIVNGSSCTKGIFRF